MAAIRGDVKQVKELISLGADVNVKDFAGTSLEVVTRLCDVVVITWITEAYSKSEAVIYFF